MAIILFLWPFLFFLVFHRPRRFFFEFFFGKRRKIAFPCSLVGLVQFSDVNGVVFLLPFKKKDTCFCCDAVRFCWQCRAFTEFFFYLVFFIRLGPASLYLRGQRARRRFFRVESSFFKNKIGEGHLFFPRLLFFRPI